MNFLEMELSGQTMMLLGGLTTIAFIALIVWVAIRYNKKKKA